MASVIVVGARGRMGTLLCRAFDEADDFELVGGYDAQDVGELDQAAPTADLLVDFSSSKALPHVLAYVDRTGSALLSGTTGLDQDQLANIRERGERSRVIWSGNYSLGVAVLRHATRMAVEALPGWDVEIVECHHGGKADAPSGTAKMLLAEVDPEGTADVAYGREGIVGPRPKGQVGMHSLRGGTVAGTHEVHFFGDDEEVCLTHRATSRQIFVNGAVAAARKLLGCEPGSYDFDDLMFS